MDKLNTCWEKKDPNKLRKKGLNSFISSRRVVTDNVISTLFQLG